MTEITVLHSVGHATAKQKKQKHQQKAVVQEVCQLLTCHHLWLSGLL